MSNPTAYLQTGSDLAAERQRRRLWLGGGNIYPKGPSCCIGGIHTSDDFFGGWI